MNWKLAFVTLSRIFVLQSIAGKPSAATIESNEKFALKLSSTVTQEYNNQNVALSPLLIQFSLALLYYGASEELSSTLRSALQLQSFGSKQTVLTALIELARSTKQQTLEKTAFAAAFYVQERLTLDFKKEFKDLAQQFDIKVERADLAQNSKSWQKINYDFLSKTNFSIGEVFDATTVPDNLQLLLASVANFKADWAQGFNVKDTEMLNFHSDLKRHRPVQSMFLASKFKYAELTELDAKIIELPYKNSELRMIIILPNKIDGLFELERKLLYEDLAAILRQMESRKLALTMPKFKVEFTGDLSYALSNLGFGNIFLSNAKFPQMFSSLLSALTPAVSRVQHKVIVEVDETGDAAESNGFSFGDLFRRQTQLFIDHPFFYLIKSSDAVLLAGHVINA